MIPTFIQVIPNQILYYVYYFFTFTDKHFGPDLVMRKVSGNQMGAYLCIASNDVPPAVSKRVILNVNCEYNINQMK